MIRPVFTVVIGVLIVFFSFYFGWLVMGSRTQPHVASATCAVADVQRAIIRSVRPEMGPLETEFWQRAIEVAAAKGHLPADVLTAKIAQESVFQGRAVSGKGARGAAQLMPMWVKGLDPFEIEPNLNKGALVLADYLKQTKGDMYRALRLYNGGPKGEEVPATKYYAAEVLARVYVARETVCKVSGGNV